MLSDLLLVTNQGLVQVGEITKRKVIDYKLNKRCPRDDIVKVKLPPKVISDCYVDISELERRRFGEILAHFTRVIERNFISLDLDYFYNNIKTLDIKKFRESMVNHQILGEYDIDTNAIILYSDCKDTIYHELFHMASSCYRKDIYFSGFSQNLSGQGLNEGYTEFLTRRYFGNEMKKQVAYEDEVGLASFIEKVVGRAKMESLYLKADLKELLKEMRSYLTQDEVVTLVSNMDKLRHLYMFQKKDFSLNLYLDYLRESYLLIFQAFVRKMVKEYQETWLSPRTMDRRVREFLPNDVIEVDIWGTIYQVASMDDFIEIFKSEFAKIEIYFDEREVKR